MRIIAFIEDEQLVKKILKYLGLWDVKRKPTPRANVVHPPQEEPAISSLIIYDESSSPSTDDPASSGFAPDSSFHRCYFSSDASPDRFPDRC